MKSNQIAKCAHKTLLCNYQFDISTSIRPEIVELRLNGNQFLYAQSLIYLFRLLVSTASFPSRRWWKGGVVFLTRLSSHDNMLQSIYWTFQYHGIVLCIHSIKTPRRRRSSWSMRNGEWGMMKMQNNRSVISGSYRQDQKHPLQPFRFLVCCVWLVWQLAAFAANQLTSGNKLYLFRSMLMWCKRSNDYTLTHQIPSVLAVGQTSKLCHVVPHLFCAPWPVCH